MKIYTFRCSEKVDLFAVTLSPTGDNLPPNICSGEWVKRGEAEAEPGDPVVGFVSRDLFRDLKQHGFHLASGIRVTVFRHQTAVGEALAAGNTHSQLFPTTDADA
jgi:hypothetical protein